MFDPQPVGGHPNLYASCILMLILRYHPQSTILCAFPYVPIFVGVILYLSVAHGIFFLSFFLSLSLSPYIALSGFYAHFRDFAMTI